MTGKVSALPPYAKLFRSICLGVCFFTTALDGEITLKEIASALAYT